MPLNLQRLNADAFCRGYCAEFALALHQFTGWPIAVFNEVVDEDGEEFQNLVHATCKAPNGKYADARGFRGKQEILGNLLGITGVKIKRHVVEMVSEGDLEGMTSIEEAALEDAHIFIENNLNLWGLGNRRKGSTTWYKTVKAQTEDARKPCSECKGNKTIHEKLYNPGSRELVDHISTCPTCSGKGYTDQRDHEHWLHSMGVSVPVDKIIGTTVSGMTEQQIDEDMHFKGYFLFREHYPWGKTLSYRNEKGDKVFLNVDFKNINPEDPNARGVATWVTWDQLKEIMKDDWHPASREDQDWFSAVLRE